MAAMPEHIVFTHPEPEPVPTRVWPVFLPFAGCPYRCVFCAQDKQTGKDEAKLETILHDLEHDLDQALADGRGPYELAFLRGHFHRPAGTVAADISRSCHAIQGARTGDPCSLFHTP